MSLGSMPLGLAMLTLFWAPAVPAVSAAQSPTFTSTVNLVTVPVTVRTPAGQPVTDLTQDDFDVFDSGTPVRIEVFRADATPITLAFVVDLSGSMRLGHRMDDARDAVKQVLAALDPGRDEAALFTFDMNLTAVQAFTPWPSEIVAKLDGLEPFGSTAIFDAAANAARALARHGGLRRAVVVVTDGADNASELHENDAATVARAIDEPVYTLELAPVPATHKQSVAPDPLRDLAEQTGGACFAAISAADHANAARQIVGELRQQYVLAFAPGSRPGWHPLDVRVKRKGLVVRARGGYNVGGAREHRAPAVQGDGRLS